MEKNSQELSKYEVQRDEFNKMPVPSKEREEFAKEMAEDAKEAFGEQQKNQ
ncbi:hypothetical protein [Paenibacillus sp. DYY-L-2]|uniref:hypothetical protein n=1 Tax=Paenibacillus sp. DYY-L-2 TaxID=3447013 RepID=UPI003F507121